MADFIDKQYRFLIVWHSFPSFSNIFSQHCVDCGTTCEASSSCSWGWLWTFFFQFVRLYISSPTQNKTWRKELWAPCHACNNYCWQCMFMLMLIFVAKTIFRALQAGGLKKKKIRGRSSQVLELGAVNWYILG